MLNVFRFFEIRVTLLGFFQKSCDHITHCSGSSTISWETWSITCCNAYCTVSEFEVRIFGWIEILRNDISVRPFLIRVLAIMTGTFCFNAICTEMGEIEVGRFKKFISTPFLNGFWSIPKTANTFFPLACLYFLEIPYPEQYWSIPRNLCKNRSVILQLGFRYKLQVSKSLRPLKYLSKFSQSPWWDVIITAPFLFPETISFTTDSFVINRVLAAEFFVKKLRSTNCHMWSTLWESISEYSCSVLPGSTCLMFSSIKAPFRLMNLRWAKRMTGLKSTSPSFGPHLVEKWNSEITKWYRRWNGVIGWEYARKRRQYSDIVRRRSVNRCWPTHAPRFRHQRQDKLPSPPPFEYNTLTINVTHWFFRQNIF